MEVLDEQDCRSPSGLGRQETRPLPAELVGDRDRSDPVQRVVGQMDAGGRRKCEGDVATIGGRCAFAKEGVDGVVELPLRLRRRIIQRDRTRLADDLGQGPIGDPPARREATSSENVQRRYLVT